MGKKRGKPGKIRREKGHPTGNVNYGIWPDFW